MPQVIYYGYSNAIQARSFLKCFHIFFHELLIMVPKRSALMKSFFASDFGHVPNTNSISNFIPSPVRKNKNHYFTRFRLQLIISTSVNLGLGSLNCRRDDCLPFLLVLFLFIFQKIKSFQNQSSRLELIRDINNQFCDFIMSYKCELMISVNYLDYLRINSPQLSHMFLPQPLCMPLNFKFKK